MISQILQIFNEECQKRKIDRKNINFDYLFSDNNWTATLLIEEDGEIKQYLGDKAPKKKVSEASAAKLWLIEKNVSVFSSSESEPNQNHSIVEKSIPTICPFCKQNFLSKVNIHVEYIQHNDP
jgi:hypothetical protein